MSDASAQPPTVTLVCWNAYPLFDHSVPSRIGGMETRAALFARGLAASGRWQVRFVVNDYGQPDTVRREGIVFDLYQPVHRRASRNVNPRFGKRRWLPIINLDRGELALLWQMPLLALYRFLPAWLYPVFWRRRPTRVVCCFGNNALTAQVIADCGRLGIPTVLCIAADSDLAPEYRHDDRGVNDYDTPNWMAHYALENADHVFVQTESQLRVLKSRFDRRGELIRNPVDISADDPARWPARGERDLILWIGRSDTFHKQPLLLLELAKRCPDLRFLMILNKTHADVFDAVQAARPPNLTIVERVPHDEIWDYYRRARVFVSTSAYEGFPNTFLQCAVMGVPLVSLEVDPDGMLARHGCGICAAGDTRTMRDAVVRLCADDAHADALAAACHRYVLERHETGERVAEFEACIRETAAAKSRCGRLPWWALLRRFA